MPPIRGLIAATFTPLADDGSLNLDPVPDVVERLLDRGVQGLYVCGSTGEGPSLSTEERAQVAAAYVRAASGRVPVVVQVGHNALGDARALAAHAREIGADAISAMPPSYFKPADMATLVDTLTHIQEPARGRPFFYYHIPAFTGIPVDVAEMLPQLAERMPDLAGAKFTAPTVHEFLAVDRERFTVLFGVDEMLFAGLASGAHGAVGSTYNLLAPQARRIADAVERGRIDEGRSLQAAYSAHVRALIEPRDLPAIKAAARFAGMRVGQVRLPMKRLDEAELASQEARLMASGTLDAIRGG
jgi:N-acetylneuraminate lyase